MIGPKTRAALEQLDTRNAIDTWFEFVRQRAIYYARIVEAKPNQTVFIEGWITRAFT